MFLDTYFLELGEIGLCKNFNASRHVFDGVAVISTMSHQEDLDLLGEIIDAMDDTHGPVVKETLDLNNSQEKQTPEPATDSGARACTITPPSTTLDQLTNAITSLTRNFHDMQQQQLQLTQTVLERNDEDPVAYKGKGKGKGKSSTRKEQSKPSTDTATMKRPVSSERAQVSKSVLNKIIPSKPLEKGYTIPKRTLPAQADRRGESAPPSKRAKRAEETHDFNDRQSDLDYDDESGSDIEYPIEFADEEEGDDSDGGISWTESMLCYDLHRTHVTAWLQTVNNHPPREQVPAKPRHTKLNRGKLWKI